MDGPTIIATTLPLVLVMDPLGNTPLFMTILRKLSPQRQRQVILREMLIALVVMLLFQYFGASLLQFLAVDPPTVKIAGGFILGIIAIRMIFPPHESSQDDPTDDDPFIVPIAIPLVAGPSALASIILYSHQIPDRFTLTLSILSAWSISTVICLAAPWTKRVLRDRGLMACERLMGLILILIAVQMLMDGLKVFLKLG